MNSEIEFVSKLENFLEHNDFKVLKEVPNMGQSVDLVAVRKNKLTFIEAKIKNWRKALIQCKAHELVADYIYIAIATKKVSSELIQLASYSGYGVIHYQRDTDILKFIIHSKWNSKQWKPQKEILNSKIRLITNEG